MGVGADFMDIIDKLWDIERFNMWFPNEHGSIAYVLDRTYDTERYSDIYGRLLELAKDETANDFAMYMCELEFELAKTDPLYKPEDVEIMESYLEIYRSEFDDGVLYLFGLVHEEYFPEWFFRLFGSYIPLEKMKRELAIKNVVEKEGYSKEQTDMLYEKLTKQYDIIDELYYYVKKGRMKTFLPCTAKKISARQLCETICKSPVEAYLYLVYLRECPEQALNEYNKKVKQIHS